MTTLPTYTNLRPIPTSTLSTQTIHTHIIYHLSLIIELLTTQQQQQQPSATIFHLQLRSLSVYSSKLTDVHGLRGVKRLETLMLQQNALTEMPDAFNSLVKLRELRLDRNKIPRIEYLNSCSSLRRLDLSFNKLGSLEGISGLQCLEELRVTNNALKSLKFLKGLPSLEDVDVSYNAIKTLDGLEFNPTLRTLRVAHNHLGSLRIPMTYSHQQRSGKKAVSADENSNNNNGTGTGTSSTGKLGSTTTTGRGASAATSRGPGAKSGPLPSKASSAGGDKDSGKEREAPLIGLQLLTYVRVTSHVCVCLPSLPIACALAVPLTQTPTSSH